MMFLKKTEKCGKEVR